MYQWVKHFSGGKSTVKDNRGKVTNQTAMDDKTVVCVKNIVEEDPRHCWDRDWAFCNILTQARLQKGLRKLGTSHSHTRKQEGWDWIICEIIAPSLWQLLKTTGWDCHWQRHLGGFFRVCKKNTRHGFPKEGIHLKSLDEIAPPRNILYTVFFNTKGIILQKPHKRVKRASLANATRCVLSEVNQLYKRARSNTGMRGIKLLHNSAPAHKSRRMQEYLSEENFETLPHPPYSPGLAQSDVFLFPLLKKSCRKPIPHQVTLRTVI